MAGPRKPPGSDWDPTLDDAEIFIEAPTAPSGVGPLPESDDAATDDSVGLDDVSWTRTRSPGSTWASR
jgi:hypothetical protein